MIKLRLWYFRFRTFWTKNMFRFEALYFDTKYINKQQKGPLGYCTVAANVVVNVEVAVLFVFCQKSNWRLVIFVLLPVIPPVVPWRSYIKRPFLVALMTFEIAADSRLLKALYVVRLFTTFLALYGFHALALVSPSSSPRWNLLWFSYVSARSTFESPTIHY